MSAGVRAGTAAGAVGTAAGGGDCKGTLCLVAKLPSAGRSKTRIAKTLGQDVASALATAMLGDLLERLGGARELVALRKVLLFAPANAEGEAARFLSERNLSAQWVLRPMTAGELGASDLGAKLSAALCEEQQHASAAAVAFIGMDSPTLPAAAISDGFRIAHTGRAFICGAEDGGYTLLVAPPAAPSAIFSDVQWSCAETLVSQECRLRAEGIEVERGPTFADIDELQDVMALRASVLADPLQALLCPQVAKLLLSLDTLSA